MIELTQDLVKQLFNYKDGFLYWKVSPNWSIKIGSKAGYVNKLKGCSRNKVEINGKGYLSSRIIFLYHHGYLPKFVDHRDRDSLNDKIENLRAASRAENNKNVTSHKNTTSKYLGVSLIDKKYWRATIMINRRQKYLGRHKTEENAALAYNKAAELYHGEFANLNIININN